MFFRVRLFPKLALAMLSWATTFAPAGADDATIDLTPRLKPGDFTRVTINFEAGGHDLVREHDVEKGTIGETRKLPMSVSAKLEYDECWLANPTKARGSSPRPITIRHYDTAEATVKVDEGGVRPQLPDDRRLILVEQTEERPILSCPNGPLSREQLDLIDVLGNSSAVDRLLPATPMADGDSWKHEAPVMASLLALDTIAVCEVQSVLEEFNSQFAKIRLAGVVHGTIDGAATEHELRGVYLFDRSAGRVARMNLAVREKRAIGDATPGLEGVAKVQMTIEPIASSAQLTDERIAPLVQKSYAPTHNLLQQSPQLGFRVEHDRKWFITSQSREAITMRRVEPSGLVAQCTLATLPFKSEGRQTTLEQFQKDVTYALGKNFGELVSTRQWQSKAGQYCYEVVARGAVEQVPVEWHYYLIAQESGHRISAAFTVAGQMVERLGAADRALVESLELIPITRQTTETAATPASKTSR